MNTLIEEKLKLLPSSPGVYKMLDENGTIIYVGKAVSLKNRVRQYFQASKNHSPKVMAMVSHIADFETIEVSNETEALTLESNLIKQYMPKYNILLKDDKQFPYIRIPYHQAYPTVEVVRKIKNDNALYIGPFLSTKVLNADADLIRNHSLVRTCRKNIEKAQALRSRPCVMYQMHKCCAPCAGLVTSEEYKKHVDDIIRYLTGHTEEVLKQLKKRMNDASDRLDFEEAAILRDQIAAIEAISEKQVAISTRSYNADVFALSKGDCYSIVYAVFVREGRIIGTNKYTLQSGIDDNDEMSAFLTQYYSNMKKIPPNVLLHDPLENMEGVEKWLSEFAGKKVSLHVPKRGEKAKLANIAWTNSVSELEKAEQLDKKLFDRNRGALLRLQELLSLSAVPTRIECFDNSHIMGELTVSSMVVFIDGFPNKALYRHFRIRTEAEGNDLAAMHEVLLRRLAHGEPYPNLLVVDGGSEQLEVALDIINSLGLSQIKAIGLSERREIIHLPDGSVINLPASDNALQLLQRIRDEAHRFAVSYHRSLRDKNMVTSVLDRIPKLGVKRKLALMDKFMSVEKISHASFDELVSTPSMTKESAKAVFDFFHSSED